MTGDEPPVILVDLAGEIVELNDAARERFPGLLREGMDHPILVNAPDWLRELDGQPAVEAEVRTGGQRYVVEMTYDPETRRFRFAVHDA